MKMGLHFVVAAILLIIAWTDHKTMKIPDFWNLLLLFCGLCSICMGNRITLTERIIGMLIVSVPMYGMICLIPGSFGGGDVKLTFVMGLYLGWKQVLTGTFLAILIGGTQAMYLLATGKAKTGTGAKMAFGPALCLGYGIAMLFGEQLLSRYLGLFY